MSFEMSFDGIKWKKISEEKMTQVIKNKKNNAIAVDKFLYQMIVEGEQLKTDYAVYRYYKDEGSGDTFEGLLNAI